MRKIKTVVAAGATDEIPHTQDHTGDENFDDGDEMRLVGPEHKLSK